MPCVILSSEAEKKKIGQIMKGKMTPYIKESEIILDSASSGMTSHCGPFALWRRLFEELWKENKPSSFYDV